MKKIGLLAGIVGFGLASTVLAQTPVSPVVQVCNTTSGVQTCSWQAVSATNPLPTAGGGSGFAPTPAYATPLGVTSVSGTVALPTGTVVAVYNVGTNVAYTTIGASPVATTAMDAIQPGGCFAYTKGAATTLAAITASSTTTLNLSGGSSAPLSCGGGGSSTGGTVTANQGTAAATIGAWPTEMVYSNSGTLTVTPGTANGPAVDEAIASQFHTDLSAPPNLDVSGTPTPWGGTTDGSYADGWGDLRKVGGTALALGQAVAGSSIPVVLPAATNVPVTVQSGATIATTFPANVTPTDCSVTLTTGGTAQNAFTAQTTLHGFSIANIDATSGSGEPIWFSFTGTAVAGAVGSYPLASPTASTFAQLTSYTTPAGFGTNHALSVIAATTSHKISCTWW